MNDVDLLIKDSHKEEYERWKETLSTLYGAAYVERFCNFETFKRHLWSMGYLEVKVRR